MSGSEVWNFKFFMQRPDKTSEIFAIRLSYFLVGLSVLQPLIISPLVIVNYTAGEAAFWIYISTLTSITNLTEGGVSQTALRFAAYFNKGALIIPRDMGLGDNSFEMLESPNIKGFSRSYDTLGSLNNISVCMGSVLIFAIGMFSSSDLLKDFSINDIVYVLVCVSVIAITNGKAAFYCANLQGIGRLAELKKLESVYTILRLFLILSLVLMQVDLVIILSGWSIVNIVYVTLLAKKLKHGYPHVWSPKIWVLAKGIIFRTFFMSLGSFLCLSGTSIIAASLPADEALKFLFLQRLFLAVLTGSSLLLKLNTHKISELILAGEKTAIISSCKSLVWSCSLVYILCLIALIVAFSFGHQELNFDENPWTLILFFGLVYFLELQHTMIATIYICSNKNPFLVPALFSGMMIFCFSEFVGQNYGAMGLICCQFVGQLLINNWFPFWKMSSALEESMGSFLRIIYFQHKRVFS
jgi:hypothetical protein